MSSRFESQGMLILLFSAFVSSQAGTTIFFLHMSSRFDSRHMLFYFIEAQRHLKIVHRSTDRGSMSESNMNQSPTARVRVSNLDPMRVHPDSEQFHATLSVCILIQSNFVFSPPQPIKTHKSHTTGVIIYTQRPPADSESTPSPKAQDRNGTPPPRSCQ